QGQEPRRGSDRAVGQTPLPAAGRGAAALRTAPRGPDGHAVVAAAGRAAAPCSRGRRGVPGGRRVLSLARDEEVQGPGTRVPEPLSRLPDLPRMPWRTPAARGAARAGGRSQPAAALRSLRPGVTSAAGR